MPQQLGSNTFCEAKWVVSPNAWEGTHTTITAAMASASSGDTIFVRDGTYTENITLKAGVNLSSFGGDLGNSSSPLVSIVGKLTLTQTGSCGIYGISISTNSDFAIVVSGSNACVVRLIESQILCTNNTGISFTNSNASSTITVFLGSSSVQTTGIAHFVHSGAGTLEYRYTNVGNSGGSSTTSTLSGSGTVRFKFSDITGVFTTSSTSSIFGEYCSISGLSTNSTPLTIGGSGNNSFNHCYIASGSAPCVSIGSTCTVVNGVFDTSNTNALVGAGTVNTAGNACTNTGSGNTVGTINHLTVI